MRLRWLMWWRDENVVGHQDLNIIITNCCWISSRRWKIISEHWHCTEWSRRDLKIFRTYCCWSGVQLMIIIFESDYILYIRRGPCCVMSLIFFMFQKQRKSKANWVFFHINIQVIQSNLTSQFPRCPARSVLLHADQRASQPVLSTSIKVTWSSVILDSVCALLTFIFNSLSRMFDIDDKDDKRCQMYWEMLIWWNYVELKI